MSARLPAQPESRLQNPAERKAWYGFRRLESRRLTTGETRCGDPTNHGHPAEEREVAGWEGRWPLIARMICGLSFSRSVSGAPCKGVAFSADGVVIVRPLQIATRIDWDEMQRCERGPHHILRWLVPPTAAPQKN